MAGLQAAAFVPSFSFSKAGVRTHRAPFRVARALWAASIYTSNQTWKFIAFSQDFECGDFLIVQYSKVEGFLRALLFNLGLSSLNGRSTATFVACARWRISLCIKPAFQISQNRICHQSHLIKSLLRASLCDANAILTLGIYANKFRIHPVDTFFGCRIVRLVNTGGGIRL